MMDKGPKPLDHGGTEAKSDERVLPTEIAGQFLADENSVDLSEFTAIKDEVVESMRV